MSAGRALAGVFDLAVVGAGILGLACARAAALRGLRVVVLDRDARANGASVRNFGFVTVTGQERGATWQRARHSCAVWEQVAKDARIPIQQRGLWMSARRAEAIPLFEAFLNTEMSEGCEILGREAARRRCAALAGPQLEAVLWSSIDLRVDSRDAVPRIAAWLEERFGVVFLRETQVRNVTPPRIDTSRGWVEAGAAVVCPGDDHQALFAERIARYAVTRCKLQMLRLADPGWRLPAVVMSELGLLRYGGYAALAQANPLRVRLQAEQPRHLEHGVHLIVVQNEDGTLIVGDSHHYAATPEPFASQAIDELILEEFAAATGQLAPAVLERWTGTYSSVADRAMFIDAPAANVRVALVTSGSGASTGFAIGEEVIAELFS